jgi:hypothetical protein
VYEQRPKRPHLDQNGTTETTGPHFSSKDGLRETDVNVRMDVESVSFKYRALLNLHHGDNGDLSKTTLAMSEPFANGLIRHSVRDSLQTTKLLCP